MKTGIFFVILGLFIALISGNFLFAIRLVIFFAVIFAIIYSFREIPGNKEIEQK